MNSFRTISRNAPPSSFPRATALNASAAPYGRSPTHRRLISSRLASHSHEGHLVSTSSIPSQLPPLRSQFLPDTIRRAALSQSQLRTFSISPHSCQDVKSEPRPQAESSKTGAKTGAPAPEEEPQKQEEPQEESGEKKAEEEGEEGKKEEKKEDAPPPPPHGDKTPWQVFMETMQTEFKASKEWNDSTKQLAQGATDFVESENVRRAREAYEKTTGAVSTTAGKVLKGTAGAVGKGAAWTWDTPVMKGVRKAANVTGDAIDKTTKPIRDTDAYKSVKSVIDDGSSSRYGGWVEKEERRKQRELREQMENPNGPRKHEVLEEDPNAGTNVTVHKDAQWKEAWTNFKDSNKFVQGLFGMKEVYNESENPLILTARSITDRVAGFFAENETAMVIKKFRSMDPAFQVEPFLRELREYILPEVLDAYVKGDVETLKLWLSEAQYSVYEALTKQYLQAGLKSDGRILDIRHVDILKARMLEPGEIPVFIITCRTQEVHVYRKAKSNELAAGMEDKVQLVTYAIGVTRTPEDVNNPETRGWRLIEMQKSAREYI
ncbi:protein translocase subunit [Diaporthe australafricana]|uniref:Protein translocase subunit n=1 Tax=Diaporthe australafricana TaxID=127596 RepID=A0ABR3X827_9PEZI